MLCVMMQVHQDIDIVLLHTYAHLVRTLLYCGFSCVGQATEQVDQVGSRYKDGYMANGAIHTALACKLQPSDTLQVHRLANTKQLYLAGGHGAPVYTLLVLKCPTPAW